MTNKIIERKIFSQLVQHLNEPEMTIILGPRQTGKTTLLEQLKDYLLKNQISQEKDILNFNLDFISDLELFQSQSEFFRYLKARLNNEILYVFVDEAQRIENTGIFFKGIYDK